MTAILPSRMVEEEPREWSDFNFHSPTQQYTPCRPSLPRSGPKPPRASPEPTRLPVIDDFPVKVRVLHNSRPSAPPEGEEWQDGIFQKKKRSADVVAAATNQQTPPAMPKILSVKGETVYLKNSSTDQYLHVSGCILDTGNDACTLVSENVAREWGLQAAPGKGDLCVKDIYGDLHHEKRVWLSLKIRNHEFWVLGAVSGSVPVLIGMDVISQFFRLGYAIGAL